MDKSTIPKYLEKEINNILLNSEKFEFPEIKFWLHTPEEDIEIKYPMFVEITKNFTQNISDEVFAEFLIGMGDYKEKIHKYKDSLELTIEFKYKRYTKRNRYKFVILNLDTRMEDTRYANVSQDNLNKLDNILVKGQCVDPIILVLKQLLVSGIYTNTNIENFLKGIFGYYLVGKNGVKIRGASIKLNLDIMKPDNLRTYNHIIVKSNTKLIKLPILMQIGDYGIYNGGCNVYIDGNGLNYNLSIFPTHDGDRFNTEKDRDKLLIFNSSKYYVDINDVTYFKDGKFLKMTANNLMVFDKGENDLFRVGDSLYVVDPNRTQNPDYSLVNDNEILLDKYGINKQTTLRENKDGYRNIIDTNLDDNVFKYRSDLTLATMIPVGIQIPMFDENAIRPGMLMKYFNSKDNKLYSSTGVVQTVDVSYNITKKMNLVSMSMLINKLRRE